MCNNISIIHIYTPDGNEPRVTFPAYHGMHLGGDVRRGTGDLDVGEMGTRAVVRHGRKTAVAPGVERPIVS
jgi:hypothetical protein